MSVDHYWMLLGQLTLAISIALLVIAVIRVLAKRLLFPRATYALWLLLPLSVLAVCLPATRKVVVVDRVPVEQAAVASHVVTVLPDENSRPLLLAVWAGGCAISWLGFALLQRHFVRRLRAHHSDGRIWRSPRTDVSPVVIGLWRPRIVLPADFESRFDADEQRLITDHETAHLRRLDVPANALAVVIVGIFWFHPLVWLAWRQFRIDQEFACDADVLEQHPHARKTYAAAMLKAQLNLDALPLGCHWSRMHPLTRRIAMLKQPTPSRLRIHAGRILLALFALSLSYGLWAQKPALTTLVPRNAAQSEAVLNATVVTTIGTSRKLHDSILDLSAPVSLAHSVDGVDWTFELNVMPDQSRADSARVSTVIKRDGVVMGSPIIVVGYGEPGLVRISDDDGTALYEMEIRVGASHVVTRTRTAGFSFGEREQIDFGVTNFRRSSTTGRLALGVKQLAVRDAFLAAASLANLRVTNPDLLSTTQALDFELTDVPADTLLTTIASVSKPPFAYAIDGEAITLSR